MAKYNVPGFGKAQAVEKKGKLAAGVYVVEVEDCTVGEPKNLAPVDVWQFRFKIVEGAPDSEGKSSVGRIAFENVNILRPEHPSYRAEWDDEDSPEVQFGIRQLKTMALAFGVTCKKDQLDPAAFVGLKARGRLYYELSKDGSGKEWARWTDWESVE